MHSIFEFFGKTPSFKNVYAGIDRLIGFSVWMFLILFLWGVMEGRLFVNMGISEIRLGK